MSRHTVQRFRSSVGLGAWVHGPQRVPCTPRNPPRFLSPPAGQCRSACFSSPTWLARRRPNNQVVFPHRHRFLAASPFQSFRSASRIFKRDEETDSELVPKAISHASGTSAGQTDARKGSSPKYCFIDDVEFLVNYRPGGYHPIAPGDTLKDGRYQIVDKLGHGDHSTVWIARDELANHNVAVKICISDITAKSQETKIIRKLLESDDDRASMIRPVLDEFVHEGPNGQHLCIVTSPARNSIEASKDQMSCIFPIPTARAIVAQLAQSMAFCHAQGVVHANLHKGNVLLRLAPDDDIHTLSSTAFYERFGHPYPEPILSFDTESPPAPHPLGLPTHAYLQCFLGCCSEKLSVAESAILLTGFSQSYMPPASFVPQRTYSPTPLYTTAPEAYFASSELGFPADIWALACVIWDVVGEWNPLFGCPWAPSDDGLRQDWVHVLGKLPEEWWAAWDGEFRRNLFTEDGAVRADRKDHFLSCDPGLEGRFEFLVQRGRRIRNMEEFLDGEKAALLKMLKAMLAYKPADRISAQDVLSTEWMLRWGLPALDDLKRVRKV